MKKYISLAVFLLAVFSAHPQGISSIQQRKLAQFGQNIETQRGFGDH